MAVEAGQMGHSTLKLKEVAREIGSRVRKHPVVAVVGAAVGASALVGGGQLRSSTEDRRDQRRPGAVVEVPMPSTSIPTGVIVEKPRVGSVDNSAIKDIDPERIRELVSRGGYPEVGDRMPNLAKKYSTPDSDTYVFSFMDEAKLSSHRIDVEAMKANTLYFEKYANEGHTWDGSKIVPRRESGQSRQENFIFIFESESPQDPSNPNRTPIPLHLTKASDPSIAERLRAGGSVFFTRWAPTQSGYSSYIALNESDTYRHVIPLNYQAEGATFDQQLNFALFAESLNRAFTLSAPSEDPAVRVRRLEEGKNTAAGLFTLWSAGGEEAMAAFHERFERRINKDRDWKFLPEDPALVKFVKGVPRIYILAA